MTLEQTISGSTASAHLEIGNCLTAEVPLAPTRGEVAERVEPLPAIEVPDLDAEGDELEFRTRQPKHEEN